MSQSPDSKPPKVKRFGVPVEILVLIATGVLAFCMYIGYFRH